MSGLILKVKFNEFFKDGNVYPRGIRAGEILELEEDIVNRIRQSGGGSVFEIIEKRVPPPTKKSAKDEN